MRTAATDAERPRAAHLGPERRRPQVLDTALAIVLEDGIDAVTMGALAERLGVTRPVVYACFADRDEVLQALLEREQQRLVRDVLGALPTDVAQHDPRHMLIETFRALLRAVVANPGPWRALFAAGGHPAIASSFASSRATVASRVAPMLSAVLRRRGGAGLERRLPVLADYCIAVGERAIRTVLADNARPDDLADLTATFLFHALKESA